MYQFTRIPPGPRSQFVPGALFLLSGLLAACGGGGGAASPPQGLVTVSGKITFDLVPAVAGSGIGAGLDYAGTLVSPAQGVTVEFIEGALTVAVGTTDAAGNYTLSVPAGRTGFIRARAEMLQQGAPGWDIRVVDNTRADTPYALDGGTFNTGTGNSLRDLHAASGWTGAGYGADRAAAPFAILDALRDGLELVIAADPAIRLAPLLVHWSPDNIPSAPSATFDVTTGAIVSTFYSAPLGGIFVLGAENSDTDEYDRHVILHEWGHYLEETLARSDSIGGPHAFGDVLDMRVAFSEGWGNAFAAMATGTSVYRDALGPGQAAAPAFDVEGFLSIFETPGWFSERSVQEVIYDIFDVNADGADALALGFGSLYDALTSSRDAIPLTSLFAFVDILKQLHPTEAPLIDAIVSSQSITPVSNGFGAGETNDAGAGITTDVLPVYRTLAIGGPAVNVCSTDEFQSVNTELVNKLATRQFLLFDVPVSGSATIMVSATSIPAGQYADPDFILYEQGFLAESISSPTTLCMSVNAAGWQPGDCNETMGMALAAGEHVLEVYEYSNTRDSSSATPPIGRTCFDVSVVQP